VTWLGVGFSVARNGSGSDSRKSNSVSLRTSPADGRPRPPIITPALFLSPSPLKGARGKEEGATPCRLRECIRTLLTQFGRPTAADALHFRSVEVRRNTEKVRALHSSGGSVVGGAQTPARPSCRVAQVSERRGGSSQGAEENPALLGVSTRPQRTKVKSICSGGLANLGEQCANALRSRPTVAPSSFPLAPFRGEGDRKRAGVMIGGRGRPSAGLVRSDTQLLFLESEPLPFLATENPALREVTSRAVDKSPGPQTQSRLHSLRVHGAIEQVQSPHAGA
jgi:hypothetical protein